MVRERRCAGIVPFKDSRDRIQYTLHDALIMGHVRQFIWVE